MDFVVPVLIISIYVGAIAAPMAVWILARRTEQSFVIHGLAGLCTALIWLALFLGFLHELLGVAVSRGLLEAVGAAAVVAFATLAVLSLVMVVRAWPKAPEARDFPRGRIGPLVADIE